MWNEIMRMGIIEIGVNCRRDNGRYLTRRIMRKRIRMM